MAAPPRRSSGDGGLLEAGSCAEHHTFERRVRNDDRQPRLGAEELLDAAEQRTAAGKHDPVVPDVACKLGRRGFERPLDRVDDRLERLRDCGPHLGRVDRRPPELAGNAVAPGDGGLDLLR